MDFVKIGERGCVGVSTGRGKRTFRQALQDLGGAPLFGDVSNGRERPFLCKQANPQRTCVLYASSLVQQLQSRKEQNTRSLRAQAILARPELESALCYAEGIARSISWFWILLEAPNNPKGTTKQGWTNLIRQIIYFFYEKQYIKNNKIEIKTTVIDGWMRKGRYSTSASEEHAFLSAFLKLWKKLWYARALHHQGVIDRCFIYLIIPTTT